jgi:hypothetical protein
LELTINAQLGNMVELARFPAEFPARILAISAAAQRWGTESLPELSNSAFFGRNLKCRESVGVR